MPVLATQPEAAIAVRTDLCAIFVSLELSRSTWLITSLSPGGGEKMSKYSMSAGDIDGLFRRFGDLQERARVRTGAGSDDGAENWAMLASPIETCKLNSVNPHAYLTDVLTRLVNNWPNRRLGELLPWSWTPEPS